MKHFLLVSLLFFVLFGCRTNISINYPDLIEDISEDSMLVITGVDVFTGESNHLLKSQDVFIEGERITIIRPSTEITDTFYRRMDGTGKVLMPGFIDTHVHIMSGGGAPWAKIGPSPIHNLHAWLFAGVTTVYDLGGVAEISKPFRENVKDNTAYGPDIYMTGPPITVKKSHPIPALKELNPWPSSAFITSNIYTIKKPEEAESIINELADLEVDYIKLICDELPPGTPHMSEKLMKALTEEAHAKGFNVFVHIGSRDNALSAARAGADVLTHAVYRDSLLEDDVRELKESGVKMILTISGFENIHQMYRQNYEPRPFDTLTTPDPILNPVTMNNAEDMKKAPVMFGLAKAIHPYIGIYEHNMALLRKYDIPVLAGTDSPNYGAYPGSSLHQEMQSMVRYGYEEAYVLRSATSNAAQMFLENPDFGKVKEGYLANLVLLKANPLEDISNTQSINTVIKRGRVVHRTFEK